MKMLVIHMLIKILKVCKNMAESILEWMKKNERRFSSQPISLRNKKLTHRYSHTFIMKITEEYPYEKRCLVLLSRGKSGSGKGKCKALFEERA